MANYTSHAIMSEQLYNKLINKNIAKINIDKNALRLFSLGHDLTIINKNCFNDAHLYSSRRFFIETIKYIRENNLQNNPIVMSYLYGHISHYALDITIHPLIDKITKDEKSKSIIKPHTIIECELDKYLVNRYYNGTYDYSFFKYKYIRSVKPIINDIYRYVYKYLDVSLIYKSSITFIKFSNLIVQKLYKNDNLFNKISRINSYEHNSKFYKYTNIDKFLFRKSMDMVLDKSINLSIKLIKETNGYLYENKKLERLYNIFDNTPYENIIVEKNYKYNSIPIYSKLNWEFKL